jgi:uncharacterized protein (DUF2147 family)
MVAISSIWIVTQDSESKHAGSNMDLSEAAIGIRREPASLHAVPSRAIRFTGRRLYAACAALFIAGGAAAAPTAGMPADPTGEWRVEKGLATIRVVDCDRQYWGVVAWELNPGIDRKNPDPAKRARPTLGMPILLGMKQTGYSEWSGQIYNSEDGHTYSAKISLTGPDTLQVRGCVFGFLCGGENWSRVNPESTTGLAPEGPKPGLKPALGAHVSPSAATRPGKPPSEMPRAAKPVAPQSAQASAQPPSPQTQSAEDLCLALVGPGVPGSAHQRGLK